MTSLGHNELTESESNEKVSAQIKFFNGKDTDECWTYVNCKNPFSNDDDPVIECDDCEAHYCIACIEMSPAEYDVMQKPDCVWRCLECANAKHLRKPDVANAWLNAVVEI